MAKYSPIEFDFKWLTMKFYKRKQSVELKGEIGELKLKFIKGSKLAKWKKKQTYGITTQLYLVEKEGEASEMIPAEMEELLAQFKEVFAKPHGMLPIKSHDHGIPLKEIFPF